MISLSSGLNRCGAYIVYWMKPYRRAQCQSRIFCGDAKGSSISIPTTSETFALTVLSLKRESRSEGQDLMLRAG